MVNNLNEIQIRPACKADLAQVYRLEQAAFGSHCYPDFFFRQGLDCWPEHFLIADSVERGPIGYLLGALSTDTSELWILSIAVAESSRGQGVGKRLIEGCLAALPSYITRVCLTVDPVNPAHHLYQSLGFLDVRYEDDYFGVGAARVVMQYSVA